VKPVTDEAFGELLHRGFEREALHLEMRDAYGTAVDCRTWPSGSAENPMTWNGCKAGAPRSAST
jgi:hypothetical protein